MAHGEHSCCGCSYYCPFTSYIRPRPPPAQTPAVLPVPTENERQPLGDQEAPVPLNSRKRESGVEPLHGGSWLAGGVSDPPISSVLSHACVPASSSLVARCLSRGPSWAERLLRFSFREICSLTSVPGDLLSQPSWPGWGAARPTSVRTRG